MSKWAGTSLTRLTLRACMMSETAAVRLHSFVLGNRGADVLGKFSEREPVQGLQKPFFQFGQLALNPTSAHDGALVFERQTATVDFDSLQQFDDIANRNLVSRTAQRVTGRRCRDDCAAAFRVPFSEPRWTGTCPTRWARSSPSIPPVQAALSTHLPVSLPRKPEHGGHS